MDKDKERERAAKKAIKAKTIMMGMVGAQPTVQVAEALDEPLENAMEEEAEVITELPADQGSGDPFADDLDLPMDSALEHEFMYVERNRGDIEVSTKTREQTQSKFAERVTEGPQIVFETSQRVWGAWYRALHGQGKTDQETQMDVKAVILREYGVMATVSGDVLGPRGETIISRTIGAILCSSAPSVSDIPENRKWAMVECINKKQHDDLLAAKIVFNAQELVFITFQKPSIVQNLYKVLEVRGMGTEEHWELVKVRLMGKPEEKVKVIRTSPKSFSPDFQERVTWWITFASPAYAFPERLTIMDKTGTTKNILISDTVTCSVCAGYGHHFQLCEYNKMKKVDLRAVFKKKKEQKREEGPVAGPSRMNF